MSKTHATETVDIQLGTDWHYNNLHDAVKFVQDPASKSVRTLQYAHAPKVPNGFTSRTEYVLKGKAFKPWEFWEDKPIEEQLVHLKEAVWKCGLLMVISKRRSNLLKRYINQPTGTPYDNALEEKFEESVWEVLHVDGYDISLKDFKTSIRSMLIPEDRLYSAPLIVYFSDKLAPRYKLHYKCTNEWNRTLTKVVKLPSEFEILTGTPGIGTVVYEAKE